MERLTNHGSKTHTCKFLDLDGTMTLHKLEVIDSQTPVTGQENWFVRGNPVHVLYREDTAVFGGPLHLGQQLVLCVIEEGGGRRGERGERMGGEVRWGEGEGKEEVRGTLCQSKKALQ